MFDMFTFQGVTKGIIFSPSVFTTVTAGIAGIIGKIIIKLRSDSVGMRGMKSMEVDRIQQAQTVNDGKTL
jgi:hypothetical protein